MRTSSSGRPGAPAETASSSRVRIEFLWLMGRSNIPATRRDRSDLTLQDLADTLSISPHNLSEIINTQLGKNFYDFVNGYRVDAVQQRLTDPAYAHLTVLAIGLDAGFNSKSSFNAVFKKHVKMTPSQYRENVKRDTSRRRLT